MSFRAVPETGQGAYLLRVGVPSSPVGFVVVYNRLKRTATANGDECSSERKRREIPEYQFFQFRIVGQVGVS
jgi:hypothetical protein